jgi:hypothetical protein
VCIKKEVHELVLNKINIAKESTKQANLSSCFGIAEEVFSA